MSKLAVERWDWRDDATSVARLNDELCTRGIARIRMPDVVALSDPPTRFFERMFHPLRNLLRVSRLEVAPRPGERAIVGGDGEGAPHIDDDELMPAHVQALGCVQQAECGGESFYIDSWALLDRIAAEAPQLLGALFEIPRILEYSGATPFRTTFSWRYGNLICSHAPKPTEGDAVGELFQDWVDKAPRYEFLAEPGDLCLINHQRMLHGRRAFSGSRKFIRTLFWLVEPFPAPAAHARRAQSFAERLSRRNTTGPLWAREWLQPGAGSVLGLPRLAAVLAYVSGESYEDVCERHKIDSSELFQWTARALSVSAVSLGEADAALAPSREILTEKCLSAIDGLIDAPADV